MWGLGAQLLQHVLIPELVVEAGGVWGHQQHSSLLSHPLLVRQASSPWGLERVQAKLLQQNIGTAAMPVPAQEEGCMLSPAKQTGCAASACARAYKCGWPPWYVQDRLLLSTPCPNRASQAPVLCTASVVLAGIWLHAHSQVCTVPWQCRAWGSTTGWVAPTGCCGVSFHPPMTTKPGLWVISHN